jgi:hypothetical protein
MFRSSNDQTIDSNNLAVLVVLAQRSRKTPADEKTDRPTPKIPPRKSQEKETTQQMSISCNLT